jgi:hypothetical protein
VLEKNQNYPVEGKRKHHSTSIAKKNNSNGMIEQTNVLFAKNKNYV